MKKLKILYENSNFYKEIRIVSFIERLVQCVQQKIQDQISLKLALTGLSVNLELVEQSKTLISQIENNFFLKDLM